jgi:CASC3/Barentsz eIF4AIII binding
MASNRVKKVVVSRRRREDEGEEEGSVAGELEDDSLSEGSIISNGDDDADIEPSDISEEEAVKAHHPIQDPAQLSPSVASTHNLDEPSAQEMESKFVTMSDTTAMMNGLKVSEAKDVPVVDFDEANAGASESVAEESRSDANVVVEQPADKSRREHLEYLKQKKENPAFVPNRGGFFLHDNRAAASGQNGFRASARGRGRGGYIGYQPRYVCPPAPSMETMKLTLPSRAPPFTEPTDRPWAHDLHESVSIADTRKSITGQTMVNSAVKVSTTVRPSGQVAPNRTFSTTVLLGKVPAIIQLPGMLEKKIVQNVAKKKHTLLPQHRPPLRRDKPVRVSLPNQQPRYIFPSTERSFIFIPRALRPNQQGFGRGRSRNSFNPSRRTSIYGGSAYSPSVTMSRRSSLGGIAPGDGLRSPAGSILSLPPNCVSEQGKPVVRFPPGARPMAMMPQPAPHHVNGAPIAPGPMQIGLQSHVRQENVPGSLTMHQPRPQKTVSLADIESPGRFTFNPPQQQEQPFHQQMPVAVNPQGYADDGAGYLASARRMSHASRPSGTPLSQIPERAIFAQPFQPFPLPPNGQAYLLPPYATGPVFYPAMPGEMVGYGPGVGPPPMAPAFFTGAHPAPYMVPDATLSTPISAPAQAPAPGDVNTPAGTVAHESNGMVYYYDSAQLPPSTGAPYSAPFAGPHVGGVVGMGGMLTPPNHFFYPPINNGVYYAAP